MADGPISEGALSDHQLLANLKLAVERSDWGQRNIMLVEFYNRYAPNLATTWLRRTRSTELTQEILQETFLRATARLHQLPGTHSVLIWLRTTARNFHLDRRRHWRVEQQHLEAEKLRSARPYPRGNSSEDAALSAMGREGARRILQQHLRALEPRDREVLFLRGRGLQGPQICTKLRISKRECRRSYARIRLLLERLRAIGLASYLPDLLAMDSAEGDEDER